MLEKLPDVPQTSCFDSQTSTIRYNISQNIV